MTTAVVDLAGWVLEQIAADERTARAASRGPWQYGGVESVVGGMLYDPTRTIASVHYEQPCDHDGSIVRHLLVPEADANGEHIARWDPERVLAWCQAAQRLIVDAYLDVRERRDAYQSDELRATEDAEQTVRRRSSAARCRGLEIAVEALAAFYADRSGYREEWPL